MQQQRELFFGHAALTDLSKSGKMFVGKIRKHCIDCGVYISQN